MGELPTINLNILGAADYTGYPPIGYTEWGTLYPARNLIFIVKIVT